MSRSDDKPPQRQPKFTKKRDYVVGKGQPPVGSRYPKGVSGNLKGRPPGSVSFKHDLEAELRSTVTVTENGRPVKVTKQRFFIKKLYARAAGDDRHASAQLIDLICRHEAPGGEEDAEAQVSSAEDADVLKALEAQIARRLMKKVGRP